MPGPPPKLNRSLARDNKVREFLAADGEIRGFDLPAEALASGEEWHPMVVSWWEAFRRSPKARLLASDIQWHTLVLAARVYQDVWTGAQRGRAVAPALSRRHRVRPKITHSRTLAIGADVTGIGSKSRAPGLS